MTLIMIHGHILTQGMLLMVKAHAFKNLDAIKLG